MTDLIMGKNTILEIVKLKPNIILEVFTSKDKNDSIIFDLSKKNIPIRFVSKKTLDKMVQSESHQNMIARIKPRNYWHLKDFFKKKNSSLVVMLDSIFDPQNLGAILRFCECFSVDGVVFSKNRGSDITSIVSKASMGATELVDLIKVSNLANTVDAFIEEGYSIVATSLDDKSSKDLYSFKFANKTLLIMGSEGVGIQKLILKKADDKVHIPMSGKLQSLNVSGATAIILSHIRAEAN